MAGEQLLGRPQREVRVVLVVDRVELIALDQPLQMRELDRDDAIVGEQNGHARDEGIEVGYLREHVLAREQIGLHALGAKFFCELLVEELGEGVDALRLRYLSNVARRFDAEDRDTHLDEPLQHVAIVGCDLDDETVGSEIEALFHVMRVPTHMIHPRVGIRREVGVLFEDVLGGDLVADLHQAAVRTGPRDERVERLHRLGFVRRQKALTWWMHPEIDDFLGERLPAGSTSTTGSCGMHGRRPPRGGFIFIRDTTPLSWSDGPESDCVQAKQYDGPRYPRCVSTRGERDPRMWRLVEDLYPFFRAVTGPGVRATLARIK